MPVVDDFYDVCGNSWEAVLQDWMGSEAQQHFLLFLLLRAGFWAGRAELMMCKAGGAVVVLF